MDVRPCNLSVSLEDCLGISCKVKNYGLPIRDLLWVAVPVKILEGSRFALVFKQASSLRLALIYKSVKHL